MKDYRIFIFTINSLISKQIKCPRCYYILNLKQNSSRLCTKKSEISFELFKNLIIKQQILRELVGEFTRGENLWIRMSCQVKLYLKD